MSTIRFAEETAPATPGAGKVVVYADTADSLIKQKDDAGNVKILTNGPIAVSDLADGTDGELITWDSDGHPDTVATGTAAQVLTSNGAGTAPTFQNAAAGFSDPMTTRGDIIYKNSAGNTTRLGAGTVGQVLTSDGTDIAWDDASGADHNLLSATHPDSTVDTVVRGDIITGQGATPKWTRLAFPGTPAGKVLIATATDVAWSDSALGTAAYAATGDFASATHASSHAVGGGDTVFPADPGSDKFLMWDDDPGALVWADVPAAGANTALSNLASVAINTSLISDTDSTDDLGSSSIYWANAYIDKIYLDSDSTIEASDVDAWNALVTFPGFGTLSGDYPDDTPWTGMGYLTSLSGAVLTSQSTPQTIGATDSRLAMLWVTDITVTNDIAGDITGNSATVTTNANLTGIVTSVGNATSIAAGAITASMLQAAAADLGAANVDINLGNTNGAYVTNLTTDGTITATVGFAGPLNGTIGATTPSTVVGTTITANTGFVPDANDGAYLGTTALGFSDLFLAEGGVINWDNGDVTLTQTDNSLTLAGGDLIMATSLGSTGVRVLKGWFTDLEVTNPINANVNGSSATVVGLALNSGTLTLIGADNLTLNTTASTDITLPTTGTLATLAGTEVLSNKVLTAPQINDTSSDHQYIFDVAELTADRTISLPLLTSNDEFIFKVHPQTLTHKTIELDPTPDADVSVEGITATMTVGENVVFGDFLYYKSDGKLWKAKSDDPTTMPVMAMASHSISADAAGVVLLRGFARRDSWNWGTVGGTLYPSNVTGGEAILTLPSNTGDQIQAIGTATHADRIWFNPDLTLIEIV